MRFAHSGVRTAREKARCLYQASGSPVIVTTKNYSPGARYFGESASAWSTSSTDISGVVLIFTTPDCPTDIASDADVSANLLKRCA